MGADLIGIGWTAIPHPTTLTEEDYLRAVFTHRDAVFEFDFDAYPSEMYSRGEILRHLAEGLVLLDEGGPARETSTWKIPVEPDDRRYFYYAGGLSWGDEPFDGFDEMGAALDAIERVPELGRMAGVIGSGIVLT